MNKSTKHAVSSGGMPWRTLGWGGAAVLLALPLVAMQFTEEVRWYETDFIVLGLLIGAAGGLLELALRLSRSPAYRAGFAAAVLGAFLLIWANLAVGIVGNEDNPFNLWFFALLAVGPLGALIAHGRASGMAPTMGIMAAAQTVLFLFAQATHAGEGWPALFFLPFWLAGAALFSRASREG